MTHPRRGAVNGKLIGALVLCALAAGTFWAIRLAGGEKLGADMTDLPAWCKTCGEIRVPVKMDRRGTEVRCPKCNEYSASVIRPRSSSDGTIAP